jgi:hypothetical protein
MRYWSKISYYTGNSLLSRLDPLDHIENPWNKVNFGVRYYMTKSYYRELTGRAVAADIKKYKIPLL